MESNENPSSVSRGPVSEESSTESDSDSFSKTVCVSRTRKKCIIEDSDSDSSGSFIDVIRKRKRTVNHLISDSDSSGSSSGSEVVRRKRSATRISSDSDSDFGPKKQAAVQAAASSSSDSDGQSEKCPICLITFKSQEVASPEACDHCFCVECIQEWSKNVNTCPVDRQPFNIILVRKNLNGKIIKQIPVQPSNQADNEVVIDDPTFCEVCGSSDREDRMLLCDGCDLGYHLECLNPPLDDVPPGVWYCSYCGPEEANQDVNIYLQEVELLLNDAEDMARPNGPRRTNATRLIPRTRQSERVRARVMTNRTRNRANSEQVEEIQVVVRHGASTSTASVSRSRPTTRRKRRKKRKQPRIRITYEIDETTGEEIRIETKTRRYKKKRRKKKRGDRVAARPKTVKKRLAVQLGICRPKQAQQTIPEVTNNPPNTSIGFRRSQAGIPSLHLFGTEDLLTCSEGEDDYGFGVVARRPNFSDVSALRRSANRKAVLLPAADGGGTCDILSSIMENQEKLYSKKNTLAVKNDGRILALPRDLNSNENRVDLNDLSNVRIRAAPTYSTSSSSSGAVNTNVNGGNSEYRAAYSSSNPSEEVPMNSSVSTSGRDERYEGNQAEVVQNLSEEDKKKNEASESDLDIYSDIETVSTSKEDVKADSPVVANINLQSDEETNNSDVDLVIDTEKEKEDQEKEKEETVTSTTQMETVLEEDKDEEEEEEEDGCPNFSIYSTETLNVAKTDLDVLQIMDKTQNSDEVGSSEDVVESGKAKVDDSKEQEEQKKDLGLYSDSDDEMVKIDGNNKPFQIGDISAMTEDISEDERSYTPCLDEKNAKEFLDGLDTEAISDEEKNDFDESHEFKTVSDGDALEINAKESELDFTRVEDFEEGEIVDKSKSKKVEEEEKKEENKENREVQKIVEKEEKKTEEKEKEKEKDSGFKKISKSNKERNYRDKERSKSREKKKDKKKEKRKEIERYNVRSVVAEKPRRMKDKFGRDARRRSSSSRSNSPYRSSSRNRRSYSRSKGRRRTQRRSRSHSRSRSRRRSRSKIKRRNNSVDRKRRKSRPRSKKRSRSFSPRRRRDWKYSISKSKSPEGRRGASPSWTPPRVVENPVKNNLTVILTNDSKKRRDKKKVDKKGKKEAEKKKRKRDKTPPPSKEVFASGDNILVSVSFNEESSVKRNKRDRVEKVKDVKAQRKKVNDLSSVKPVAIIDLDRSPFKELTPSPNDVIVLSDSDNNENLPQENVCDSSQQPENYAIRELRTENYGPKTPPEPQVKFSLNPKATQIRAINNPLHEPDDLVEIETQAEVEHKGPNTPPEPPNSPPSSPDAYDPFDPTKSRSPTPDKCEKKQEKEVVVEKVEEVKPQTPDVFKKSHTPPVVPEIQAADSQSNAIPAEIVKTSPERTIISVTKSTPQTTYSIAPLVTSTPISTNPPRINILNTTILTTPTTSSSAITPRNPLPKPTIKISPTKNMSIKKMNESNESCEFDSPYSPGPSDYEDLFEPPAESTTPAPSKPKTNNAKTSNQKAQQNAFDNLFGSSPKVMGSGSQSKNSMKNISNSADRKKKNSKAKIVGVKMDEESLKILDDVPNSAVEMQVKDKFLKKLNRQERVVEEVKLVLKPHYNKKHINKEEYKDILRRSVPKICHNKSGEINPKKIQNLIEAYVKKIRHSKKVTSSSNTLNPQK